MELVLFAFLVVLALLVPWLGKDSRQSGDWHVPFEARRSPVSNAVSDHFGSGPRNAAPAAPAATVTNAKPCPAPAVASGH
ncbi:hypothetical protein AB0I28_34110 [Phytomonospora sp. NPDC050363]|uniref:hypothetical protein n=1 Tax=Phytomonospora sp. NPDC050363 TaxID=3155642 RepID=UPI0033F8011B